MGLWVIKTLASGEKIAEIDLCELRSRLKTLSKQDNVEIMQLALQSIVDELDE